MNNKSRKAKGRILQNLVRDKVQKLFPSLGKDDIRTSLMSEAGADVKLISLMARKLMPYDIETKNREEYKTIYKHYKHACKHGNSQPLLVIKMNRENPLAVIDLDHFMELLARAN
jgi:hypothetical protein|tara:strand:- start:120 stop:464 length:345 start_codon:yes stop_codon:yes gene_type:complete